MNTALGWDLWRSFAAVLRTGSLSAAARELGLTQPSLARHIQALEQHSGGALFLRSQRGLSPTARALALRPQAEAMAATAAALHRAAAAPPGEPAGTVRITASEIVAIEHLPPILAALRRRHPALAIELAPSNALDDLLQRRADIAVRMVRPAQQALLARHLGALPLGLHAHRDYLARRPAPAGLADLIDHDVIGPDTDSPLARAVMAGLPGLDRAGLALRSDSDLAHLAAIRAGLGIGVCQLAVARRDPALVRVLPGAFTHDLPVWLAMHEDLRDSPGCRATFDALADGLSALCRNEAEES